MREGVLTGRIDTVRAEHTPEAMGATRRGLTTTAVRSTCTAGTGSPASCAVAVVRTEVLGGAQRVLVPALPAEVPLAGDAGGRARR